MEQTLSSKTEKPPKISGVTSSRYGTPNFDWEPRERAAHIPKSRRHQATQIVQRVLDVIVCGVALLLLLPFFALIALCIKLDSHGPVLFTQTRVGRDGHEFPFYKFRSMVADAEAIRHLIEHKNERGGPVFKMKDDPRITRSGRILRRLSLDELPQLLNVLAGRHEPGGPASRAAPGSGAVHAAAGASFVGDAGSDGSVAGDGSGEFIVRAERGAGPVLCGEPVVVAEPADLVDDRSCRPHR